MLDWKITNIPQTLAVPASLPISYSSNNYCNFLLDKLPFTSALTGMSHFNRFSTTELQSQ